EQAGRRAPGQVRHHHRLPTPAPYQFGLGQRRLAVRAVEEVVAALDPHVRTQLREYPVRGRLVEGHDRVDAVERGDQPGPVGLRDDRPARTLQRADRLV